MTSTSGFSYYLVIVGQSDNPIYELEYSTKTGGDKSSDHRYLTQFIAQASLDLVDEYVMTSNNMYLKCVDKFNEWFVTAFVANNQSVRFLLLHSSPRIDDNNIKSLFVELYDLYTKFAMNPLYEHHTHIRSNIFDKKAHLLAKKYLP
ncbi:trafficking protein particle complex subunit 2-like [Oppia nitens]|uniref:trafficking protein particle complex subunit 2-like n=1 Tax=Oppia nitens TaxID=1686743 RepID=UPI0023DB3456|nr:trafficking protein particle complex subunit 2-like [Oppia nitens]